MPTTPVVKASWLVTTLTTLTTTIPATPGQTVSFSVPTLYYTRSPSMLTLPSSSVSGHGWASTAVRVSMVTEVEGVVIEKGSGGNGKVLGTVTVVGDGVLESLGIGSTSAVVVGAGSIGVVSTNSASTSAGAGENGSGDGQKLGFQYASAEMSGWTAYTSSEKGGVVISVAIVLIGLLATIGWVWSSSKRRFRARKQVEIGWSPGKDEKSERKMAKRSKEKKGPRGIEGLENVELGPAALKSLLGDSYAGYVITGEWGGGNYSVGRSLSLPPNQQSVENRSG